MVATPASCRHTSVSVTEANHMPTFLSFTTKSENLKVDPEPFCAIMQNPFHGLQSL